MSFCQNNCNTRAKGKTTSSNQQQGIKCNKSFNVSTIFSANKNVAKTLHLPATTRARYTPSRWPFTNAQSATAGCLVATVVAKRSVARWKRFGWRVAYIPFGQTRTTSLAGLCPFPNRYSATLLSKKFCIIWTKTG